MKIWIDIYHIPQFNFYLPLMQQLAVDGHVVYLTVLDRGRLPKISKNDLQQLGLLASYEGETNKVTVNILGHHRMTKWSAILDANLLRIPRVVWWRLTHKVDIAFSNGFHAALACWLTHTKNYCFGDDPDTKDYKPRLWFSNQSNYTLYELPQGKMVSPKVNILRCTKEWAYLNPRTFKPNVKVLEKYGLQPKQYLFLREVSVGTVNYAAQSPQAILSISPLIQQFTQWCQAPMCNSSSSDPTITQKGQTPLCNIQENSPVCTEGQSPCANFKVLFSLEEKHRRSEYPADWILLQEPIEDIHSLMYYAAGLVSSGDSMAREAALLGIPAYYLGVRHSMPANLAASKVANLQNETTQPFEAWLRDLAQPKYLLEDKTVDKIGVKIEGEIKATSLSPEQQSAKRVEYLSKQQDSLRQKIDSDFIDINAYMLSLVEGEKELNR